MMIPRLPIVASIRSKADRNRVPCRGGLPSLVPSRHPVASPGSLGRVTVCRTMK